MLLQEDLLRQESFLPSLSLTRFYWMKLGTVEVQISYYSLWWASLTLEFSHVSSPYSWNNQQLRREGRLVVGADNQLRTSSLSCGMMVLLEVILESMSLTKSSRLWCIGNTRKQILLPIWLPVIFVRDINQTIQHILDYCSLFLYLRESGLTSLWILLKDYLVLTGNRLSWL